MFPDAGQDRNWSRGTVSRVPYWVYSDADLYARELERIFYGRHWSYVGLEAELPTPRSFKGELRRRALRDRHARPQRRQGPGRHAGGLLPRRRFAAKRCIFDTELIPNSLIYPI